MKQKILFATIFLLLAAASLSAQSYYIGNPSANCAGCHSEAVGIWQASKHAGSFTNHQSFLSFECMKCHNTGWDTETVNYGVDEYVTSNPGGTPDYTVTDQTNFDLVKNVQCESCHGTQGTSNRQIDFGTHFGPRVTDFGAEKCGTCHNDKHHPYFDEWTESTHSSGAPSFINRASYSSCMKCHFTQDFVAYVTDPAYDATTFQVEGGDENLKPITCVACHDPHGNSNDGNLRNVPDAFAGKPLCDVCHNAAHVTSVNLTRNPSHTKALVIDGSPFFGFQYPGQTYENSFHTNISNRCESCHVHKGADDATGHKFLPSEEKCQQCHADFNLTGFDYRGVQTEIMGLIDQLQAKLDAATSADSLTDTFLQARYNLRSAQAEGSYGIHNTKLVRKLLNDAIGSLTGVASENGVPATYQLAQNYPNPFNPATTIKFSVPEASNVKITVYDALGEEISVLVNEYLTPGNYNTSWNAAGNASGIYLYKLETTGFTKVMKMLLVK